MLKVTNLQKTFNPGTINAKTALNGFDLHIAEGDFVTVIGGNGAGKSTLLNAIAGVWKPDYGTIEIDGVDVTNMPEHKRAKFLGRVFQDPMKGTAPDMEIAENLSIAARRGTKRRLVWGCTRKDRENYRSLLAQLGLGLEDRLSSKVGLLSGGQRQAVTLLMATIRKPKILLLDEHTAALDPKTADNVLKITEKLVTEHKLTTLMITHNMHDAIAYGNRLIMMHEGMVVVDVSGQEKKRMTINQLLDLFEKASGSAFSSDKVILSK
ncbi:MAG: ABC transporter ATP-binding protein [Oscillospiraceae bacterium]|nr:ABC transporter ATP-binding protein [Oscillospiraceae bacterium]